MANRRFYQFLFSKTPKLTTINGIVTFGASGAVSTVAGAGVSAVTKLTTGIYQIKLADNYVAYSGGSFIFTSGTTGSAITAGSFVTGTLYQITALGNTNWVTAGVDSTVTAAVGTPFVAVAAGSGTGTATVLTSSNIFATEVAQSNQALVKASPGLSIILSTYGLPASGQNLLLTSPVQNSQMEFRLWMRDSSVLP